MSLRDKRIPNETPFIKLKDFPDNEIIAINNLGISEGGKYGPQPYLIAKDGTKIMLPNRYENFVRDILQDADALKELQSGIQIEKKSRSTQNGGTTPTFYFI